MWFLNDVYIPFANIFNGCTNEINLYDKGYDFATSGSIARNQNIVSRFFTFVFDV